MKRSYLIVLMTLLSGIVELSAETVETKMAILETKMEAFKKDYLQEVEKLSTSINELSEDNKRLNEKVKGLQKQKSSIDLWLKLLGFPLFGLTVFNIYLWFAGIKKKAEDEVETASKK